MPKEETTQVFTMFSQPQGRKSSKTSLFTLFFIKCAESTVFCDAFSTRGFKCTANTTVFFIFYFKFSRQTSQKHWFLQCVDKTNMQKTQCFETIFHNFQLVLLHSKKKHFLLYFCHCSSGLKKVLNRTKLLNCT